MLVEVSLGEAIDKLTILKIKLSKIKDYSKLENVRNEHDLLEKAIHKFYPRAKIFPIKVQNTTFGQLYKVNKKLWDVEDNLRNLEKEKDFGIKFVNLARSVYILNDKRASIKKKINIKYKSKIVEEKSYEQY